MSVARASLLIILAAMRGLASPACAECHSKIYEKQMNSRHARALRPFAGSQMALSLRPARESDGTRFVYQGDQVSVSRNGESVRATLAWAFGAGSIGYTAIGQLDGAFFEHRVSHFAHPSSDGITPGQVPDPPHNLKEGLGVFKSANEIYLCFNCHSTGLTRTETGGPNLTQMTPGIQCERCHGPGQRHIDAARKQESGDSIRHAIFDSATLPAKASVEVCGGCHRISGALDNPGTIRFQPVGLMASRCFRESAGRLSCLTCHDPHMDAVRNDAAYYRTKCLECHANSSAKVTECKRRESGNCLTCHMRRQNLMSNAAFTDHRIRVY